MSHTPYDIRLVAGSDPANLLLGTYAFTNTPAKRTKEEEERYLTQRRVDKIFMSYVDGDPAAKVGVIPMTENVRGKLVPMGGITGVASMPVARRGGHIRALLQHAIETMHTDGQVVSTLYPFKSSYYEMFGYAGFQVPMWTRIKPEALAPYMSTLKEGSIKQRLSRDAKEDIFGLVQRMHGTVHGMGCLPQIRVEHEAEEYPTWFVSVHETGQITGGLSFKVNIDGGFLEVQMALWSTDNAMFHLLDFLSRHVDQVKEIRMPLLPGNDPHLWVSENGGITILSNIEQAWNAPMGRIVSIAGLNGIPVGDGEISITVRDSQAPWNDGVWTLAGAGGELHVRAGGVPTGDVSINGLSSFLYTGLDPKFLTVRGWGSVDERTADTLQSLFPPAVPHLHEMF